MSLTRVEKTPSKQLTSTNENDILFLVADEAHEKSCSLKTKQSRKNVNVNSSYYM